jgi:hypothetical protein
MHNRRPGKWISEGNVDAKVPTGLQPEDFAHLYDRFRASLSRYDCGRHCSALNKGEPVCCTTRHAVPVLEKTEFLLLKSRTDLWRRYRPDDAEGRRIVADLGKTCCAVECKGARHCERDNRSIACRAFPFYPYVTRDGEFVGLAFYWVYRDRCWVISNLDVVERDFVEEFVAAYEYIFTRDAEEFDTLKGYSATHRRVFSRLGLAIPLIGRNGGFLKVLPHGGAILPMERTELTRYGPYVSDQAYGAAVIRAGGRTALAEAAE